VASPLSAVAARAADSDDDDAPRAPAEQAAPAMIRVLLVDEDPLARRAVRQQLEHAEDFEVTAEATTGAQAIQAVAQAKPDIVLIDAQLTGIEGILAIRQILQSAPEAAVVIFSANGSDELGLLGIHVGASGYLSKDMNLEALPRVLRGVLHGEAAVSRVFARRLIERLRQRPSLGRDSTQLRGDLSAREWDVLDLVCRGERPDAIAADLGVSLVTIRRHLHNVMRKLNTAVPGSRMGQSRSPLKQRSELFPAAPER
jgi:DNA-binding NarL/FixJ family response regulator